MAVTGMSLEALDAVPWDRLESALPRHPVEEVPRALRRLALAGGAATEEHCSPLYWCLAAGNGRVPSAATAALPFVVALAADPGTGARVDLVGLLVSLKRAAKRARPDLVDEGWHAEWRRHRDAVLALLADPDPDVRREALPLADGVVPLLARWRPETDPAMRLPVLLKLGEAAGEEDSGAVEEVRAVLDGVLRDGEPVMKVAAVIAWARLDPQEPVRRIDLLVETLSDLAVRPRFEEIWYLSDVEEPFTREAVVTWAADLFDHDARTAASFVVRLADVAARTGDAKLSEAVLDEAWRLLVLRPSAAPALLPVAGGLLDDPADPVRLRAAHLLAVLGRQSARYADRLATLIDDAGEDSYLEGTVGDYARWALTRIGDPRALPGLVERLYEPYREHYGRGYCVSDPRLPDVDAVLVPLRAHADVLLPALREVMRHHAAHNGGQGPLTGAFLKVLKAWGPDALPALPEVLALLDEKSGSLPIVEVLAAMGPGAASAEPALRTWKPLNWPGYHWNVAWAASQMGGDRTAALRLIGDAVLTEEGPYYGPVHLLTEFGPAAAPYADRVRHIMENTDGFRRIEAALALWSGTGQPEPSISVLVEFVLPIADGGDDYGLFGEALRALARIGTLTPATRAALRTVRGFDGRLAQERNYEAFLQDEELRAAIEYLLALP
ncbi:hypothetical protein [Streptomyces mirabilis]|uniref:HEAT repeat-containing protein n=1 Tax=Streptomyces mirabilis TaxID=68239 RepID=A0A1I2KPJ0_9ACTN|nr:hypothetical protein [Streptomyces mirabilis]SFF67127.1 hypothetical protein SAMN02787118_110212 [Streptomyces mirabilis]